MINAALGKVKKYHDVCTLHGLMMKPFVFSTLGLVSDDAKRLINKIAQHHPHVHSRRSSRAATALSFSTALSVSIMRDNSKIISDCFLEVIKGVVLED